MNISNNCRHLTTACSICGSSPGQKVLPSPPARRSSYVQPHPCLASLNSTQVQSEQLFMGGLEARCKSLPTASSYCPSIKASQKSSPGSPQKKASPCCLAHRRSQPQKRAQLGASVHGGASGVSACLNGSRAADLSLRSRHNMAWSLNAGRITKMPKCRKGNVNVAS